MKALWMIGFAIALSSCAAPAPEVSIATTSGFVVPTQGATLAAGRDCATWQVSGGLAVCKDDVAAVQAAGARAVPALAVEHPAEIVGTEAHHAVLDGAS